MKVNSPFGYIIRDSTKHQAKITAFFATESTEQHGKEHFNGKTSTVPFVAAASAAIFGVAGLVLKAMLNAEF